MSKHGPEPDCVVARSRIESRNRERERRAARRDRRSGSCCGCSPRPACRRPAPPRPSRRWSPRRRPSGWSTTSVILLALAVFGVPAPLTVWLARHRGRVEPFAWAAITLVAEVALFWVGFVGLGYGPE